MKIDFRKLKKSAIDQLSNLQEVKQLSKLKNALKTDVNPRFSSSVDMNLKKDGIDNLVTSSLATFLLHVEARQAAYVGKGFYTIGPCGEENMACLGLLAKESDAMTLHYRHLASSISRQLKAKTPLDEILMDRARGYTLSKQDSVTAARHVALGSGPYDFYLTSTLGSHVPTAVARSLGFSIASQISKSLPNDKFRFKERLQKFSTDDVSIVSFGEGSLFTNHILSALNFSDYAIHQNYKLPILFVVTDNQLCISLKNKNFFNKILEREKSFKTIYRCHGQDVLDVYEKTKLSLDFVRKTKKPAILVLDKVPRRFGHAATDRQNAYLSENEVENQANVDVVLKTLQILNTDPNEMYDKVEYMENLIEEKFNLAMNEERIQTREECFLNLSADLIDLKTCNEVYVNHQAREVLDEKSGKRKQTMRENMTEIYDELLTNFKQAIYLGEDVRHGGYYLVTNNLEKKHGHRVIDIPPDETMLSAFGMGYAQCGLFPIVEFPYAKYLDCGADLFYESVLTSWCTNGRQQNGILFRLQGFDRGVFGGNFHTHNSIYTPPGLDVVCYSNGEDYVKGIRYCFLQIQQGRVILSVDSTDLLNKRSKEWMFKFPTFQNTSEDDLDINFLKFGDIFLYSKLNFKQKFKKDMKVKQSILIYTYGTGVHESIKIFEDDSISSDDVAVIDAPYLTDVPGSLIDLINQKNEANEQVYIIFADVCKSGSGTPLSSQIMRMKQSGFLDKLSGWSFVAAQNTYNPIGTTLTFLNYEDVKQEVLKFMFNK